MPTVQLTRISPQAWEHPADARALAALRALPGFDVVVRKVHGQVSRLTTEPAMRLGAVRASQGSHPELIAAWLRVCRTFDIDEPWELLVLDQGAPNAAAVGVGPPVVVVTRGLLALLTEDELAVVLGHEVGHILSDHILYKTMLRVLLGVGWMALSVPLAPLVMVGLIAGLQEWDRKSELSADRASLLVAGDPQVVIDTLQKVQKAMEDSGQMPPWLSSEGREVDDYADKLREVAFKVAHAMLSRHPMTETRIEELLAWQSSGEPGRIRAGDHPRRDSEPQTRGPAEGETWQPWEAWREPLADLQAQAASVTEPAEKWLRGAQKTASARYGGAVAWLRKKVEERGGGEE